MIFSIVVSVISVLIIIWMLSNEEFLNKWERAGDYELNHPHSLVFLIGGACFPVINVVVLIILLYLLKDYAWEVK